MCIPTSLGEGTRYNDLDIVACDVGTCRVKLESAKLILLESECQKSNVYAQR